MPTNNYIAVLEKAVRVLEAFHGERGVALGELAARTGLVKSSIFRILFTLGRLGYIEKGNGGRYSLTSRFGRLAGEPRPAFDLSSLAAPFMAQLLQRFQETINLGILEGGEVLYIHVIECSHAFRLAAHAGMRSPVHSTALGKCLLCQLSRSEVEAILKTHPLQPLTPRTIREPSAFYRELERVRARGYAIDNEEDSRGARCIAAPIFDPEGGVRAAISLSGPAARVKPGRDAEIAKAVTEACRQISTLLGHAKGFPRSGSVWAPTRGAPTTDAKGFRG
jgi:DNA-binding IclR family transcriptional regulator